MRPQLRSANLTVAPGEIVGLILADEPSGNLDPATSEAVFQSLHDLVRATGVAALVATHNLEMAKHMDRVLALRDGRLV